MATSIAEKVDEKGILQIRSLIARYGLEEFLQAVELEMTDIVDSTDKEEEEHQIAAKVRNSLDRISGTYHRRAPSLDSPAAAGFA